MDELSELFRKVEDEIESEKPAHRFWEHLKNTITEGYCIKQIELQKEKLALEQLHLVLEIGQRQQEEQNLIINQKIKTYEIENQQLALQIERIKKMIDVSQELFQEEYRQGVMHQDFKFLFKE